MHTAASTSPVLEMFFCNVRQSFSTYIYSNGTGDKAAAASPTCLFCLLSVLHCAILKHLVLFSAVENDMPLSVRVRVCVHAAIHVSFYCIQESRRETDLRSQRGAKTNNSNTKLHVFSSPHFARHASSCSANICLE